MHVRPNEIFSRHQIMHTAFAVLVVGAAMPCPDEKATVCLTRLMPANAPPGVSARYVNA